MKAQERHHLKENDFAINLKRAVEAAGSNSRNLLMGAGAFVLVVAIGSAYFYSKRHSANVAGEMLGVAMAIENVADRAALVTAGRAAAGRDLSDGEGQAGSPACRLPEGRLDLPVGPCGALPRTTMRPRSFSRWDDSTKPRPRTRP